MGAWGWEYGDGSYFFLTIYFQEKLFLMTFKFSHWHEMVEKGVTICFVDC